MKSIHLWLKCDLDTLHPPFPDRTAQAGALKLRNVQMSWKGHPTMPAYT